MLATFITIICIILDQFTKHLVVQNLKNNPPMVIIDNFLTFTYLENTGAAFGILKNRRWIFILITIISIFLISYILFKYKNKLQTINTIALSLILGGAIGNLIDRIRLGYVVDFVSMRFFNRYNFAVFNLADTFVVIGSIIIIIFILFSDVSEK